MKETIKICSCGKHIKDRNTITRHKREGHKITNNISIETFKFCERQIENMKYIALIGLVLILTSSIALGQEAVITSGTCLDNDNIRYTTLFTMNGQQYNITDNERCTNGCQIGLAEHGDSCAPTQNEVPIMPFVLWIMAMGAVIQFWRMYGKPLIPSTLLWVTTLGGMLVMQHPFMWIIMAVSTAIWIWKLEIAVKIALKGRI